MTLIYDTMMALILEWGKRITRAELNAPFTLIARQAQGSESVVNGGPFWTRTRDLSLIRAAL